MILIVFTRGNRKLPNYLYNLKDFDFKHIWFDSTKLDDLLIIAQYRIISYPTSIITKNNKILFRIRDIISYKDIKDFMSRRQ